MGIKKEMILIKSTVGRSAAGELVRGCETEQQFGQRNRPTQLNKREIYERFTFHNLPIFHAQFNYAK